MPLTDIQAVRQRIQDEPGYEAGRIMQGDGVSTVFSLPVRNLTTASAFVGIGTPTPTAWSATGATFNPTGYVTFANPISANSAFMCQYAYSVFSDDVISAYLVTGGGVNGAALQCAYDLLFDALKRASWRGADGSTYDDRLLRDELRGIISALKHEEEEQAIFGGAMASWAENQGLY